MLTLVFYRTPKRRIVGLLALGEWGSATGAISGSVSTEQARQKTLAGGTVSVPVHADAGTSGGLSIRPRRYPPLFLIPAITGVIETCQNRQQTSAVGEVLDAELEMVTLLLLELA